MIMSTQRQQSTTEICSTLKNTLVIRKAMKFQKENKTKIDNVRRTYKSMARAKSFRKLKF